MPTSETVDTRASWNRATANHNAHKGDQAAFLRDGGDTLFPEELALVGDPTGKRIVHLQCNSGQDSLCLARRGAMVVGVDFSDEAIRVATELSAQTGIEARFVHREVCEFLESTDERFDVAFTSYGSFGWLPDLDRWAQGIARVLAPTGELVLVDFHPLVWSVGEDGQLSGDDYFARGPYVEPVKDYVARSGPHLHAKPDAMPLENDVPASSFQYGVGELVTTLSRAGLVVLELAEFPYANGCRLPGTVPAEGRRWVLPPRVARIPLMFALRAARR
jgi:SAM-dependent methyltransferase